MYKYVLRSIEGVETFPIIALIIFFSFFVGLLWWVMRKDKTYINHLSAMPFDKNEGPAAEGGTTPHFTEHP
jgi:cbb3-type cytochrome oxidase subunit 3